MDTIFCPNKLCGKELSVKFKECPFCGTPLDLQTIKDKHEQSTKNENKTDIKVVKKYSSSNLAESVVTLFAWFNLVVSIIFFLVLLVFSLDSYNFNWALFGIAVGVLLSTTLTWALPLVLVNISRKLDNL